jgi:hypothetical protein
MDRSITELPDSHDRPPAKSRSPVDHATGLILQVCRIAGSPSFVDDARESLQAEGIPAAVRNRDTAALFDWLVSTLSYQGIADQVAYDYMERHGQATWQVIASDLRRGPSCPKLKSYWHFHGCRYNKTRYTCAESDHLPGCPLPNHWLRNGRLNQTAEGMAIIGRSRHRIRSASRERAATTDSAIGPGNGPFTDNLQGPPRRGRRFAPRPCRGCGRVRGSKVSHAR